MILFAVDPGTIQSALVVVEQTPRGMTVREHYTALNAVILAKLHCAPLGAMLVIEQIEAMGMAVGHETFETVFWSGRFYETWPNENRFRLPRRPIKLHLCGSMQAKDANVRQALIDRFGGSKEAAIGTIKKKGPLYGLVAHEFAALAVAVTWIETRGDDVLRPVRVAQADERVFMEDSRRSESNAMPLLPSTELQREPT